MIPAKYDFSVWRGTSGESQGLKFQLVTKPDPDIEATVPVPFTDVRLRINKRSENLLSLSIENGRLVHDEYTNIVEWIPTTEETRKIPIGAKATYELEVWNGPLSEVVYMYGTITGVGGINDDEDEAS